MRIMMIIIVIIIIKSGTGPSGKTNIISELLSPPHNHLRHGKLRNKLSEETND